MKDKPDNAPLIVLLIGDNIRGHPRPPDGYKLSSFKRLDAALKKSPLVQRVVWQDGLAQYPGAMNMNMINQGNINTIIIDPFSVLDPGGYTAMSNVEKASDFIFKVRELYPGIVIVLYFDFKKIESIGSKKESEHGKLKEIILEPFFVGKKISPGTCS